MVNNNNSNNSNNRNNYKKKKKKKCNVNNNKNKNNNKSGLNYQGEAPLSCRAGQAKPKPLVLASTDWHQRSMVGKRMTTLPG